LYHLTEVNCKNTDFKYEMQELIIPNYTLYHNIENRDERGVLKYISCDLDTMIR